VRHPVCQSVLHTKAKLFIHVYPSPTFEAIINAMFLARNKQVSSRLYRPDGQGACSDDLQVILQAGSPLGLSCPEIPPTGQAGVGRALRPPGGLCDDSAAAPPGPAHCTRPPCLALTPTWQELRPALLNIYYARLLPQSGLASVIPMDHGHSHALSRLL
jgi:hypothetical protein